MSGAPKLTTDLTERMEKRWECALNRFQAECRDIVNEHVASLQDHETATQSATVLVNASYEILGIAGLVNTARGGIHEDELEDRIYRAMCAYVRELYRGLPARK